MAAAGKGYTLLELIVAMAIVAATVTAALPSINAVLSAAEVDQAAFRLTSALRLARVVAVHGNRRARVVVDATSARFTSFREIDGGTTFERVGPSGEMGKGVFVDIARSTRIVGGIWSVTFEPRGHTANNGTLAISIPAGSLRRVVVASSGRIRIR